MFRFRAFQPFQPFFTTLSRRQFSTTHAAQDVAKLSICGRVFIPPEVVTAPSGITFVKYGVVTSFGRGDARRSSFWRIAVFDERQKEMMANVGKGALVFVDADIELKYLDSEDGKKNTYINLFQRSMSQIIKAKPQTEEEGATMNPEEEEPIGSE